MPSIKGCPIKGHQEGSECQLPHFIMTPVGNHNSHNAIGRANTKTRLVICCKGPIIFYLEGGRLFVIAGRQFFLVPPWHAAKKLVPLGLCK